MNTCVNANNGKNDIIFINKHLFNNIITLCAYAQQGYVFGRVRLYICIFIYICMSTKKQAV